MRDNPNFPPLTVFVIYDPGTDAYMEDRYIYRSGSFTFWSKNVRDARRYRDRRAVKSTIKALEYEGHGKLEVKMLDD